MPDPTPDPTPDPKPDPAPDPKPDPTPTPDPKPDPAPEPFDQERAMATIAAQRASETKLKADLKEAQAKAAKFDAAEAEKLSAQEKLAKEAEDAKALAATAQTQLREAKLLVELAKPEHGIVNAQAAAKLLEGVEYSEDGAPTNLTEKGADGKSLLDAFLEANAFLKGTPQQGPSLNGGPSQPAISNVRLTDEELAMAKSSNMTAEEYAAYKDPAYSGPPPKT